MSISGSDESAPPRDGVESLDGADSGKSEAVLVVWLAGGSATADSSVAIARTQV